MEGLLAEINNKRKALEELDRVEGSSSGGNASSKYMRRADIERAKEEEERKKRAEAKEKERAAKMRKEVRRYYSLRPHLMLVMDMPCSFTSSWGEDMYEA